MRSNAEIAIFCVERCARVEFMMDIVVEFQNNGNGYDLELFGEIVHHGIMDRKPQ